MATMNPSIPPRSVYLLSDANAFATELVKRLESSGFQVETVADVEEFAELLLGLSPHAMLVDASHVGDLAAVGAARREVQQRSRDKNLRIPLLALASDDSLTVRLEARRAGVGALLLPPFGAAEVVSQLKTLLAPAAKDGERVLIVEDDRAQALFAQSVLNNAGMQAEVEHEPLHVLDALAALRPDLILMDLHMPDANGAELTALIREHPSFGAIPIVFLSGESDPEARFAAIDAGGDDFLAKPIRPRHLIATVRNRVSRARKVEAPAVAPAERDPGSGLHRREFVLARIQAALDDGDGVAAGVLFVKVMGASALRDRVGLAALDKLFAAVGRALADGLDGASIATAITDDAFLVLAPDGDETALTELAGRLRDRLSEQSFEAGGMPVQLRIAVGACPLRAGYADAGALLDVAERTCREARAQDGGIKVHVSPEAAERRRQQGEEDLLRQAIAGDRIDLAVQAIVAIKGSVDARYQTFARLRHDDGRVWMAAEILPIALRAGVMVPLDRCVLTRALAMARHQRDRWAPVQLFVPQSLRSLVSVDHAQWIKQELARQGVEGASLLLQCSLDDALLNPALLATFAASMRELGVGICLVNYRSGSEADAVLEAIAPAFIRLAASAIAANASPDARAGLARAIERAHALGIKVIGAGVEDAQVAASLWMSGIDFIQGNLVHPVSDSLQFDFREGVM